MSVIQYSRFGDNILYEGVYEQQAEDLLIREYVDFPRRGVQITGGAKHNEAIAFARRMKSELVKAGLSTEVFYRFSVDDNIHGHWANNRWEEKMTARAAARWLHEMAQGGIVPSYNNEPTAGTLVEIALHAEETLRYLKEQNTPPVAMLNWHTGFIPNLENHYGGEFDTTYALMQARGDWAAFHGYMNTRFLDDPQKPLYIGRHRYVTRKFPRLKLVYTEFGFDSHAPNPEVDGFKNHTQIWAKAFHGKRPIDVYWDESVKADETILAAEDVVVLFFCRYDNGTSRWNAFDYSQEGEFNDRKKKYRSKTVSQTVPAPTMGGIRVRITQLPDGITRRNIRDQPRESAVDLTTNALDLKVGDEVTLYKDHPSNGWLYIDRGDVKGWVLFAGIQFVLLNAPPAASGIILTHQEIDALNIHLASLRSAADGIERILKGAMPADAAGGF